MMKLSIAALVFFCSELIFSSPAQAYLDPGSTSMIWQLVLSVLAGLAVFFKFFWKKLVTMFNFRKEENRDSGQTD